MPAISSSDVVIVGDTEYTCFGESLKNAWSQPGQYKEIVQIAAIKFNLKTGEELGVFNKLVRPSINSTLTKRFIDLTHITQDDIEQHGDTFTARLAEYMIFCNQFPIWIFNGDGEVFKENCRLHNLPFPFREDQLHLVRPRLEDWGIDPNAYSSGTLYKAVGLQMDGHVHNALHDVRSMAAFLHYIHTY